MSGIDTPHQPRRDDDGARWLKRERDRYSSTNPMQVQRWCEIDRLLDRYREHADYGLTLRLEDDKRGDP